MLRSHTQRPPKSTRPRPTIGNEVIALLSVSPYRQDHDTLASLLRRHQWSIHKALSLQSASTFLQTHVVPLVICEHDLLPGTWTQLSAEIQQLSVPPFLIVTSRVFNDYLWAEALNLGAYDVLAKPFDPKELTRILSSAWLHWYDQYEAPIQSPKAMNGHA